MKQSKLALLIFVLFAGPALFFTACQKEGLSSAGAEFVKPDASELTANQPLGAFSKEIVVKDKDGRNSLVLQISGNDESIIREFAAGDFALNDLTGDKTATGEEPGSDDVESLSATSNFGACDVHISILRSEATSGADGIQLVVKPRNEGATQRVPINFWLHNSAYNYSKVWDYTTFYVEGYYCGTWPYWTKCCAGWRSNTNWVARGYCGNRSIHVTDASLPIYFALKN